MFNTYTFHISNIFLEEGIWTYDPINDVMKVDNTVVFVQIRRGEEMKIIIKSFEENNAEKEVEFSSEFGEGTALWQGTLPKEGIAYDVEIEIPNVLKWGKDIHETKKIIFNQNNK